MQQVWQCDDSNFETVSTTTYKARWRLSHGWDVNSAEDLVKINGNLHIEKCHKNFIHHTVSSGNHQIDIGFIFQCESDPKHTSNAGKIFPDRKTHSGTPSAMEWPHHSSNLDITEAVWDHLKAVNIQRRAFHVLQEAWRTIPENYLKKWQESCLREFRLCWRIKVDLTTIDFQAR